MTDVIPRAGQKRAKSGNVERSISLADRPKWVLIWRSWASKFPCVYTAPLAGPVLPVVNKIAAVSFFNVLLTG